MQKYLGWEHQKGTRARAKLDAVSCSGCGQLFREYAVNLRRFLELQSTVDSTDDDVDGRTLDHSITEQSHCHVHTQPDIGTLY